MLGCTELHTYLTLTGNQRLPHLEEEIFADETATAIYLHNLCKDSKWYDSVCDDILTILCCYVYYEITKPLPAAEQMILKSSRLASWYARIMLKSRWPEAESIIATDTVHWHGYINETN